MPGDGREKAGIVGRVEKVENALVQCFIQGHEHRLKFPSVRQLLV